jgi:bis(5'-adenosyl)-triphosphatase
VHAHIIPRKKDDLSEAGGTDAIYAMMESEDGDLDRQFQERQKREQNGSLRKEKRGRFPAVDADNRQPRSEEEMRNEAEWLAREMDIDAKNNAR